MNNTATNKKEWDELEPQHKAAFRDNNFSGVIEDDMKMLQLEGIQVDIITRSEKDEFKQPVAVFYCCLIAKGDSAAHQADTLRDAFYGACYALNIE